MNYTNASEINVYSYLSPDPLDSDSGIESEFLEFLPGYDGSEMKEDEDEHPIYRQQNIEVYERIEKYCVDAFRKGLDNMFPLLKDHIFRHIQIAIDLFENVLSSRYALACYHHGLSEPAKGKYIFQLHHTLFLKYLAEMENKYVPDLRDTFTWEHEILHLLDHEEISKSSILKHSSSPDERYKSYLLKYREEGIADLYYLLHGGFYTYKSIEEATSIFLIKSENAKSTLNDVDHMDVPSIKDLFSGLSFYEIGPWLILDALKELDGGYHIDKINTAIDCLASKKEIETDLIIEIVRLALRVKAEFFLDYVTKLNKEIICPSLN